MAVLFIILYISMDGADTREVLGSLFFMLTLPVGLTIMAVSEVLYVFNVTIKWRGPLAEEPSGPGIWYENSKFGFFNGAWYRDAIVSGGSKKVGATGRWYGVGKTGGRGVCVIRTTYGAAFTSTED